MASLQNSVPLQATVPRQKAEPPTFSPMASSSLRQRFGIDRGDVDDQQVLHVGGAQFAAGKTLGEIRGRLHLLGRNSPAQRHRSHIRQTGLLLRVNSDVIAIDVIRRMLFDSRIELESDALLQFAEKTFGGPSMPQEEKFQPRSFAMFAQHVGIAEQLSNAFDHRQNLIPANKCVQARPKIGFGRKPAGDSQGKSDLGSARRPRVSAPSGRYH